MKPNDKSIVEATVVMATVEPGKPAVPAVSLMMSTTFPDFEVVITAAELREMLNTCHRLLPPEIY